jgi:hypothetical protein
VAETTHGQSGLALCILTAASLYLNSPTEVPKAWGQIDPNLTDYNTIPMQSRSTFCIADITDWWYQYNETYSEYIDLSNLARNIFSNLPHGITVKVSFVIEQDSIRWGESTRTGGTLREKVVIRPFAQANNGILAGDNPTLDTTHTETNLEMKKEDKEGKLHRMAMVHHLLELWQGSQNVHATQNESCPQHNLMTDIGYISDLKIIVKAYWSLFQQDGAAEFKLSERSALPPALTAKDLPGGRTHLLNVCCMRRINRHPVESDQGSSCRSISDTEHLRNSTGDFNNPNHREDDCAADDESDIEQINDFQNLECAERQDVCTAPNVPGMVPPIHKPQWHPAKVLVLGNAIEIRRNEGVKYTEDRVYQWFTSFFM